MTINTDVVEGTTYQVAGPPAWLTTPPQTPLPAYQYVQYDDDPDTWGFFAAYNELSQTYLTNINALQLPVYTGLFGPILDWVGSSLYGYPRPIFSIGAAVLAEGVYNSNVYDLLPYNAPEIVSSNAPGPVPDDIYQRCLTWQLYTGDGRQFTINWLKRRVYRFLIGANGTAPPIDNTYPVSVTFSSGHTVTIAINPTFAAANQTAANALQSAIETQSVQLPFQYNFIVTI